MSGINSKPDVLNQIDIWRNGKGVIGHQGVLPLVIPPGGCVAALVGALPEQRPVATFHWIGEVGLEQGAAFEGRPAGEVGIKQGPTGAPGGPTPAIDVTTEVVTCRASDATVLKVVAADAPDPLIITIARQQGGAIHEEIRMGHAVIFQDDAMFFLGQKPGYRSDRTEATTLIDIGIELRNGARPVDASLYQPPCGCHLLSFAWPILARAIGSHIDETGSHRAYRIDHPLQRVLTTPDDEKERNRGGISHIWVRCSCIPRTQETG